MSKPTLMDHLRYKFDNYMSSGTAALILGLAVLSTGVILLAAVLIFIGDIRPKGVSEPLGFTEAFWESLMRTLDPGTMGGDEGWRYRLVMFGVTLGGIFVISTLIGVLTSGIENKVTELRKGRSRVIERNHTVILGWSSQVFSIVSELIAANANQPSSCIAILGQEDKVRMEDEIKAKVGKTGRTRIVCRTGSPSDLEALEIVSLETSCSIIIVSQDNESPDAGVINTMLAILNRESERAHPYHIVAEIRDRKNMEIARVVGKGQVEFVLVSDLIAKLIAQTCRQSGLSVVYTEILDFSGDEIYFKPEPALTGMAFGEALMAYEDSAVIGLYRESEGARLNPPMDTIIADGDQIIVISEDDDTIHLSTITDPPIQGDLIQVHVPVVAPPEHILILGWNRNAATVVRELDCYVSSGSSLTVVSRYPDLESDVVRCGFDLDNMTVEYRSGDATNRAELENLNLGDYRHIIVLAYSDQLAEQEADAITLITLLHVRDLAVRDGYDFAVVSEMLDIRNRALAEITRADDFIVSNELASLMISQVSENKHLNQVFEDIFDSLGSEIYLKPASDYVAVDTPISFYTVVEAARRRNQVAFGYRCKADVGDASKSYGVVVNPDKSQQVTLSNEDRIIVLAEE